MSLLRLYLRVLSQLGSEARLAIILAVANLGLATAQFADPVLFGRIIDQFGVAQSENRAPTWPELIPLLAAWTAFGLFSIAASVLVAFYADRLAHRRRLAVTANYFDHVLHLPLGFHTSIHSGRLLKIMLEGASSMFWLWLSFFRENCASVATLFVLLPVSLLVNWRLGALLIVLVIVFAVLTNFVLRKTQTLQSKVEQYNTSLAERASDALGNVAVIQSFTLVESESRTIRSMTDSLMAIQIPVLTWWAVAAVAQRASATLTLLAIFLVGTYLHLQGRASVGQIVTFMSFAGMLIGRLEQVVSFANYIFMAEPKLKEFFDILDTKPNVADRPGAVDAGRLEGRVAFEHVSFSYDGKRPAVSDISFDVAAGETIALVGATGSGKSTTLGLLHRIFDPDQGRILIDGTDIRDMTVSSLRRNIGVVFQEPMLFARSIEENLRVGKADASPADLALAIERAQAKDFIEHQPNGLATIVGERGRSLSGGERQRLSIARALLKDPPILIFDEATSALDAGTEQQLQRALEQATLGRTTFIIAHRLATIRNATRILVFDMGRLVESGSFDELVAANGRFATLARAQFIVSGPPTQPAAVAGE